MYNFSRHLAAFILITLACTPASADPLAAKERDATRLGFIKGYSWGWVGHRGEYDSPEAAESMQKLADTGTEWVCIAFSTNMRTADDPEFTWSDDYRRMVTDDEICHAIDLARASGLKVILKPVVNIDDGTWRAWIKFFRPVTPEEAAAGVEGIDDPWGDESVYLAGQTQDLAKWDRWWANFNGFVTHYAQIAEEKEVELFCLGCEMNSTEQFEDRWRALIIDVRSVYHGLVTYDINHGREHDLPWWDAVDLISISGYYGIAPANGRTEEEAVRETTPKEEIVAELRRVRESLAEVSAKWGKPVLMIETGCTNVRGCARYPWSHPDAKLDSPLDEVEQRHYYEAFFEVFWGEPWFMGYCWWDWPARLYAEEDAASNRGFCVYGKQAEEVLRAWYAKEGPEVKVE